MKLVCRGVVPERAPSQNATYKAHWLKYYKIKKRWRSMMFLALGRPAEKATGKRLVRITRVSARYLDNGNMAGGCKPILDILVDLGWIVDDTPQWLTDEYRQEKRSKGNETIIEIYKGDNDA